MQFLAKFLRVAAPPQQGGVWRQKHLINLTKYNLSANDKEVVDLALSVLAQIYDQYGFENPNVIFRIREKIKKCSTVQLITDSSKRTFADEA